MEETGSIIGQKQKQKLRQEDLMQEAKNFFDSYKKELGESFRTGEGVVKLNFMKLAEFSPILSESVLEFPEETTAILETALEEAGVARNVRTRLVELPKSCYVNIREIRAKHLDSLLWVEGIVRQASDVRPQVVNAKFECPNCGALLSVLQIGSKFSDPSRCSCGWKGNFKLLSKEMVDVQRLIIEESPDSLEGGEQPRRINIFLKEDLVDPKMEKRTAPGSRIKVYGVLKEVPVPLKTGAISTRFDIAIEANNTIAVEESFEEIEMGDEDERRIKELAADSNIFWRLSQSVAPSIYGFDNIKKSVLLQLFGGVKKLKSDGGFTRGDIHVLLVGDPGVAKSVLLKTASTIAPKGRYVSGKAATAAGLTAAVVKDEFLRGWSLEGGAMVLSNKGMVCIDEIEKMSEHDRSTMHEAMEQQCYLRELELTFADGTKKKIGEFVDALMEKNKDKIQEGNDCEILQMDEDIKLLTTDFESIYPARISKVSRHVSPDNFVKIKLYNGREITVTPGHPCWTLEDGKITTIPAEKLRKGEFFPIPGELPIEEKEQVFESEPYVNGPELCKLIGYHITDGCYELNRGKKNGIQFWNNNEHLIKDYCAGVKRVFDIAPGITKRNHQFAARVVSKKVVDFFTSLDENLMEKGKLKKIPDKIMQCRKEDLAFLLRSAFDGDGTVVDVKRGGCRVSLVSENKKFAEQVSELLLRFGILSSVFSDKNVFRVDVSGYENLLRFYHSIGFLSEKKIGRLKKYLDSEISYRSIADVVPNVSEAIRRTFRKLKIKDSEIGGQICVDCGKHRRFLKKMIVVAERKIEKILELKKIVEESTNSKILGGARINLGLSALSVSKKLGISDYMLIQNERADIINEEYKKILISEIDDMLSVIPLLSGMKKLAFGKIRWARIKDIRIVKNEGEKWVYDVTVDGTHSFVSNNMVLHNSVTISKANIQATLRAETTVLAAGNPKFGRFDPYTPIPQQIDISPALLSRFDVIFVIRDLPNKKQDEAIATHVLEEHKQGVVRDVVEPKLLRKYIAYARRKFKPRLTDEAIEEIKNFYLRLRSQPGKADSEIKPIPITARQLEGIVRLSEAHAKMRLSNEVTVNDARVAIELLKISLMQVGYDEETKSFDVDRITTGVTASKRGKIIFVKESLSNLESRVGKLIPEEELQKAVAGRLSEIELEEAVDLLIKSGDIFRPKKGFVQRI